MCVCVCLYMLFIYILSKPHTQTFVYKMKETYRNNESTFHAQHKYVDDSRIEQRMIYARHRRLKFKEYKPRWTSEGT